MQRPNRSRALRSRTPPPPRHPRQRLNPLLPPLLVVHIRRPAHRAPLRRPRHPTVPPNRQPTRCEQTLPPLHLLAAKSAEPAYPARQHKVLRLPRIPLVTVVELPRIVAVECGEGRSEFVEAAQEPLCGGSQGGELERGVGSDWRNVLWNQDPEAGEPHV